MKIITQRDFFVDAKAPEIIKSNTRMTRNPKTKDNSENNHGVSILFM